MTSRKLLMAALAAAFGALGAAADDTVLTGDVNGDGTVNATDVADECKYIIGETPDGFLADRADVNGDGTVNVADATKIAETYTPADGTENMDELALTDFLFEPLELQVAAGGTGTLSIVLDNPLNTIASFQFELVVPDGVTAGTPVLTSRAPSTHDVFANRIAANRYMVVCVSTSLRTFSGTSGVLVEIPVTVPATMEPGDYTIELENVDLVRPRVGDLRLPDAVSLLDVVNSTYTVGLTAPECSPAATATRFFTLDGRPALAGQRGIVIAVTAGKATRKVLITD